MPEGDIVYERRRHFRAQKVLHIKYKIMAGEEYEKHTPDMDVKRSVVSEDISTSGLQLICDEEMKLDKVVRLDVELDSATPLATFAEVRWVRYDEKLKKFRIGLQFLVIKEDHILAIKKLTGEL